MVEETRGSLAVTWWGHSSMSLELGGTVVATDPVLTPRVWHLQRLAPPPAPEAARADVVLVSHLHRDHLHLPSLRRFPDGVPVVVPRGATRGVRGLAAWDLVEVEPGDVVEVAGVGVQVLPAYHDGRRSPVERLVAPAVGFRLTAGGTSVWYPGDTGPQVDLSGVAPVDLAAVPIGGWGPSLGDHHVDPEQAASLVETVGARWSLAVHYGTFWPLALRRLRPRVHRQLFVTPPERFRQAVRERGVPTVALTPPHGRRLALLPVAAEVECARGGSGTPERTRPENPGG